MIEIAAVPLVSLLGFVTGTILYAMLLWMVLSSGRTKNRLPLLTGIFGLVWNIGSFASFGLVGLGIIQPVPLLLATAFGALCFLPAVVVHSAVRTSEGWARPWNVMVVTIAYAMSAGATLMHLYSALVLGVSPSQFALRALTAGFAALLLVLLVTTHKHQGWVRGLCVAALAVFAVSALHLSTAHAGEDPWWLALVGHHASLPLALVILYQDYKFALADIFLKRALSLILLVGLVFGVYVFGAAPLLADRPKGEAPLLLLMTLWAGTALIYPWLRAAAYWFVDKIVLHRVDYGRLVLDASRAIEKCETPETILATVAAILAPALTSDAITWTESADAAGQPMPSRRGLAIVVRTVEPPQFVLNIGPLSGGRRLLSDDQDMLERVAFIAGQRIDTVRAVQERYERNIREQEIRKLAAEAELRALRAQINPHFLFNALTTIGYLIQTSPTRAVDTLLRLSGLLRAVLRSAGEIATVGEELDLVEAYLDIESARFEDRLHVSIDVPKELRSFRIPGLILQPLVENAIKHGIGRSISGGEVRIAARLDPAAAALDNVLVLSVSDTGAGALMPEFERQGKRGIGLENVERRVRCYGGDSASVSIKSIPGRGTTVEIRLPVTAAVLQEEHA